MPNHCGKTCNQNYYLRISNQPCHYDGQRTFAYVHYHNQQKGDEPQLPVYYRGAYPAVGLTSHIYFPPKAADDISGWNCAY